MLKARHKISMVQSGTQTDSEREVTKDQYDLQVERTGRAFRAENSDSNLITLYDQVDGTALRVERSMAMQLHLKKIVSMCSVCRQPSPLDIDIENHIRVTKDNAILHKDADASDFVTANGVGKRCSACDAVFISRPRNVYDHISKAKESYASHQDAKVLTVRRFSLEPLVIAPVSKVVTAISTEEPMLSSSGSENDRNAPAPRRRRRRHHKGGSA
jgi:hypothetical protein